MESQKTTDYKASEIIEKVLQEVGLNAPSFAKQIGLSYQRIFNLQNGRTKQFNSEIVEAIISKFPQINKLYLYTGEGSVCAPPSHDHESLSDVITAINRCMEMMVKLNDREKELDKKEQELNLREKSLFEKEIQINQKEIEFLKKAISLNNK